MLAPMDPTPTTVVKFGRPADIVGLLPYRVGFHPSESVVIACLHGRRSRMGLVMRHDLVPAAHEDQLVDLLAWHVRQTGAEAIIVAIYTAAPDQQGELPRRAFVEALGDRAGVKVPEALLVRDGRWWSYVCDDPACCPPTGTLVPPEPEGAARLFAAELAVEGRAVMPARAALEASIRPPRNPVADAVRAQALDTAADAFMRTYQSGGLTAVRAETLELLRATARRWAEGKRDLSRPDAARIVLGLRDKLCRDEAAKVGLEPARESYLPLLVELCRHSDGPEAAPVCTLLGWVAYMHGDGGLANVALDRALSCEPGYEMAQLLLTGLQGQVPPAEVRAILRGTTAEGRRRGRSSRGKTVRKAKRRR
jgi:uncharacterized protein DUF4192